MYKAVSEISQLMYLQKQVQEMISQEDSINQQLLVTSVVLNATLQEACHWVSITVLILSLSCIFHSLITSFLLAMHLLVLKRNSTKSS